MVGEDVVTEQLVCRGKEGRGGKEKEGERWEDRNGREGGKKGERNRGRKDGALRSFQQLKVQQRRINQKRK